MSESKRENRKNGNQESSEKAGQEGSQEDVEKEVGNLLKQAMPRGAPKAPPEVFSPPAANKGGAADDLLNCDPPQVNLSTGERTGWKRRGVRALSSGGASDVTRRRWIADVWDQSTASLIGEQASHLVRVLRAETGMEFDIVAGDRVWRAAIAGISGDQVRFNLLHEVESDRALPVALLISIFKFDRMEWVVEKATELGAARLVPMIARRTDKHLARGAQERVERWRRIAREAAQQSRRSDVPVIGDVVELRDAARAVPQQGVLRLLLAEQQRATTLHGAMSAEIGSTGKKPASVEMAVGPEGGWTAEEEMLFTAEGWKPVSLGPRILRAETAAIAAMAVVAGLLE